MHVGLSIFPFFYDEKSKFRHTISIIHLAKSNSAIVVWHFLAQGKYEKPLVELYITLNPVELAGNEIWRHIPH